GWVVDDGSGATVRDVQCEARSGVAAFDDTAEHKDIKEVVCLSVGNDFHRMGGRTFQDLCLIEAVDLVQG
ncbi:hypothetical protein KZ291_33125, partial [Escherichia coli]|nr:hypothetical protein [Escherichia coli]